MTKFMMSFSKQTTEFSVLHLSYLHVSSHLFFPPRSGGAGSGGGFEEERGGGGGANRLTGTSLLDV